MKLFQSSLLTAPSAVFEVQFTSVQSKYVNLTWRPPKQPNGKIGYYVTYWIKHEARILYPRIQVPSGRLWCLVTDLKPSTVYTFSVTPYNLRKHLKGPSVNKSTSTLIDGRFPQGLVTYFLLYFPKPILECFLD